MAKTHKFLIVEGDSDCMLCDLTSTDCDKVSWNEEPCLRVIECEHSNFQDNIVTLIDDCSEEHDVVKATNGKLYYFTDYWSKVDVVNAFE